MTPRKTLAALAMTVCLGGCAGQGGVQHVSDVPTDPHSLVYTYLMAHGMAFGYVMAQGRQTPDLGRLIALDHNAWMMVLGELKQPSDDNLARANGAVLSLIAAVTPRDTAPRVDQRSTP